MIWNLQQGKKVYTVKAEAEHVDLATFHTILIMLVS